MANPPVDAVLQAQARSAVCIGVDRGREGMRWNVELEEEEPVADDVADVQCSRVAAAEGDGEEGPAARGGDDAASEPSMMDKKRPSDKAISEFLRESDRGGLDTYD
ncbi:hypothetical protein M7I_3933 [Glarea lozoyensis 74030]|uniref:Uncharacterized protein n=1 Tax=Glarea lozoyensis (strain ATCC 74030 / MF5533) TaxID=1104152 RepID=H0EMT5_GLAL7|nr:hypothetical protein M7I_3933 [Glarea lozoyensis 74030]